MPLNEGTSTVASLGLAVLTFSSMQMFKQTLQSSQLMTILGGFIGSFFFVFLLTALGNALNTCLLRNVAFLSFKKLA